MKIRKRNGSEVDFNHSKITKAILKANVSVGVNDRLTEAKAEEIAKSIEAKCMTANTLPSVESVQDMVVYALMKVGAYHLANNYITYRYKHELLRKANSTDAKILSIVDGSNAEAKEENANKNPEIVSVQCDYIAGEVSRDITERLLLPAEITAAHKEGIIHFHDGDYFIKHAYNCCLVNLEDMLQNGTVISGTKIDKPHLFSTACNISTQIIAQVASNTYGGQTISLTHLASFVNESRKRFRAQVIEELTDAGIPFTDEQVDSITEKRVRKDVEKGIQTIQYQVVTLMTTNGQAPFITVFLYLNECGDNQQLRDDLAMCIEEMLKQRIQGVKNKVGVWVTPAFPKLIYVLEEDNIHEDSKYWELTKLAAKCSAKRLVPDYISEKVMKQLKVDANGDGQCFPAMGCRSFLMPYIDPETNKPKYYGRFNQGVVTISLPDVALSSGGDMQEFWRIFEERLELCHRALRCRHERLKGTLTDIAPILWQDGAIARMTSGETIDKLLYGNYSTISLGYAGLFECVKYMTGKSHTDESAKSFALAVMQKMNDKCEEWRKAENIGYSLYGTPLESTTYKFAKCLRPRFGTKVGGVWPPRPL